MSLDLHDGYLNGIVVHAENTLVLHCKTAEGKTGAVTIPGLVRLRADNFNEGNIIFELNFYRGSECPDNLVKRLKGYDDTRDTETLSADMESIREGDWTLLELTSSYGCDLLALFDRPAEAVKYEFETGENDSALV